MDNKFERTIGLIGEAKFDKITTKTLLIFGLGGVGGTAFEALVRTGFNKFVIVDFDKVSESNLNRQILYTSKDINKNKCDVAKERALQINEKAEIINLNLKIDENSIQELEKYDVDFVIDCVDDVDAKIAIAKFAQKINKPLIVSLGMANRVEPSEVIVTKLNRTTDDPLAKKVRYEMKKSNIDISRIDVVFSKETPYKDGNRLNSTIFVPSSAGLNIASYVFNYFIS